jgi:hypothetical protein
VLELFPQVVPEILVPTFEEFVRRIFFVLYFQNFGFVRGETFRSLRMGWNISESIFYNTEAAVSSGREFSQQYPYIESIPFDFYWSVDAFEYVLNPIPGQGLMWDTMGLLIPGIGYINLAWRVFDALIELSLIMGEYRLITGSILNDLESARSMIQEGVDVLLLLEQTLANLQAILNEYLMNHPGVTVFMDAVRERMHQLANDINGLNGALQYVQYITFIVDQTLALIQAPGAYLDANFVRVVQSASGYQAALGHYKETNKYSELMKVMYDYIGAAATYIVQTSYGVFSPVVTFVGNLFASPGSYVRGWLGQGATVRMFM